MSYEPGAPTPEGMIPLCVPEIKGNEWKYVKECLDTNWVSSVGPFVDRFEAQMAEIVGAKHAVATMNGTAALHVALLVTGVQPEDEVLVPALTFVAPANAVRYVGAWPVFIDVEPEYWQMDPAQVTDFLEAGCDWKDGELHNKTTGRRVKAVLPVHVLGHPVDMDPILEVAAKYELIVIEDATEALGSTYKQRTVGSLGQMACFSFNGNKVITTGGGGMIVTSNGAWAAKARYLTTQAKDDPLEYIHHEIGYNYRLTNVQAAMGCAQLERLDKHVDAKRRIAGTYSESFENAPGIAVMREAPWARSIFWMYTVLVEHERFGMTSRDLLRKLGDAGIQARPLWHPIHSLKPFADGSHKPMPVSDRLYSQALSLPSSVGLTDDQQAHVIDTIVGS